MTVKEFLISILEESGYEVFRQGSLLPNQSYPNNFWTFYNIDSEELYYNNEAYAVIKHFSICFYTNNPSILQKTITTMRNKLKENNFMVSAETDIDSDEPSHIGLGFICVYQHNY